MRSFEENIAELRKLHDEKSSLIDKEFDHFISEMEYKTNNNSIDTNNKMSNIGISDIILVFIIILIF